MARLILATILFLYVLPLAAVSSGHEAISFTYIFIFGASSLAASLTVLSVTQRSGRRVLAQDHAGQYVAPIQWIYGCAVIYLVLKFDALTTAIQGLSAGNLAQIMLASAVERYSDYGTVVEITDQFALMVLFLFFSFWGSRIGQKESLRNRALPIAFSILAFFIESLALARAGFLLAILCFLVEAIIRANRFFQMASVLKLTKFAALTVGTAFFVYAYSQYFRVYNAPNAWEIVMNKLAGYTIASHDLFLSWLDMQNVRDLNWGQNTFTFAWKIFGLEVRQGFYEPMVSKFGMGNIYLNLRGLVQDFGMSGSIILWAANIIIISTCSFLKLTPFRYLYSRFGLAIIIFPIYSPFLFTNFALSFFFAGVMMAVFGSKPLNSVLEGASVRQKRGEAQG